MAEPFGGTINVDVRDSVPDWASFEPAGSVALVTGASSGIGRAIAQELAAAGVLVALVARDAARLAAAAASIENAVAFVGDVGDGSSAEELVGQIHDRFGRIDILVNNAGRGMSSRVEALDIVAMRALFDLNVFGAVALMQAVIPGMRERGRGAILNVSSGTSLERYPGLGAYAASKSALNALTFAARAELAADGITVGLVYPGPTATSFEVNASRDPAPTAQPTGSGAASASAHPDVEEPSAVAATVMDALRSGRAETLTGNLLRFGATLPTPNEGTP